MSFEAKKNLQIYRRNFSDDKRTKGGKIGNCVLCLNSSLLRLSHIVPKWVYYWAKQEAKGRFVGRYTSLGVRIFRQDGSKEYLLCESCEQYLAESEKYIKILMHGSTLEKNKANILEDEETFFNLNFELIQRFIFGITIKSHYTRSAPFHNVKLRDVQVTQLRNRIFNPLNEDMDFTIIAMRFYSEVRPGIDPKAMMIPGQSKTEDNTEYISFLIAGWEWILFLNENRTLTEKSMLVSRLKKKGSLFVPRADITVHRNIRARESLIGGQQMA